MRRAGRSNVRPRASERGTTLLEVLVAVAAAGSAAALAQRPARAATDAAAFAGLVGEARALAAITVGSTPGGGGGATIGVVTTATGDVATLYAYRPIAGAQHQPVAAAGAPSFTAAGLALLAGGALVRPPFALFFSPSGHVSAQAPFLVGSDAALEREPACAAQTGIAIAFLDGVHDQGHALGCEAAQLDLATSIALDAVTR
jgi:hypothetical protein